MRERLELQGEKVCGGIGAGKLFFIDRKYSKIPHIDLKAEEIPNEINRFQAAVTASERELENILSQKNIGSETASILEAHKMMLTDPTLSEMVGNMIKSSRINAEWAVLGVFDKLISVLDQNTTDYYVKAKIADWEVIRDKLVSELTGGTHSVLNRLPDEDFIVCAKNLTVDELHVLSKNPNVKGIVLESPGGVSHLTMVLRSLEIPAVMGVPDLIHLLDYGDMLIVNGFKGRVVLRPAVDEINNALRKADEFKSYFARFLEDISTPSISRDNRRLRVGGNIDQTGEVDFVKKYGGEFIGLFRTELMFSKDGEIPSEDAHYDVYYQVLHQALPLRAAIRIFDFGEDKSGAIVTKGFMGMRGIRLCKGRPDVFIPQIRALVRAAKLGNLDILLPFVSTTHEVDDFRNLLYKTAADMGLSENLKSIRIGAMIEVPASVFIIEKIADEVDFFSIGTNDLIQYLMAVERKDQFSSDYFSYYHPAVLRVINQIVTVAKAKNKPVNICGEMASDPYLPLLFLAMGIDALSMNPASIPIIKKIIKCGYLREGEEILSLMMAAKDREEVIDLLKRCMVDKYPNIFKKEWNY
ncbi:phosphoenolpyruvate--protein phosphotransferase [bacterium]|nr:phosphoenolpyruvate--protein phosphotransferase [bacterium]